DHHEHSHDEEIDKLNEDALKLTHEIIELQEKLDRRSDAKRIQRAGSLKARVEALEDPSCPDHEHQCGGDDPQCVSDLLVCDGIKDCRNGDDESHCHNPFHAGDDFVGDVVFDHCTKRRPENITLSVESISVAAFFPGFPKLHVHVNIHKETDEDEVEVSLPSDAIYSFAEDKLIVYPSEDDGLGLVGQFDGYNFDRFVGDIIHEASKEHCARFIFHRK
nr:Chain O, Linker L3 [Glossoscolex paulistus]4U8U_d Chain d, Linker L3 [Glossoscolex paulistus]4U8U_s Chain s, Linker L3 [Glossoscolex paulistus]